MCRLEELPLAAVLRTLSIEPTEPKMLVGGSCSQPAPVCTVKKTELHHIRLDDVLQCITLLPQHGGERLQPDRSAFELFDYSAEEPAVELVQAEVVDLMR